MSDRWSTSVRGPPTRARNKPCFGAVPARVSDALLMVGACPRWVRLPPPTGGPEEDPMVLRSRPDVVGPTAAHQQVRSCGRCGRRFPHADQSDPGSTAYCEPCRAAMWAADRDAGPDNPEAPQAEAAVPARQCGRCRELFEGDPNLHRLALADWWVCSRCRGALFGTSR